MYVANNPIIKIDVDSLIIQSFPDTKKYLKEYIKPTSYPDMRNSNTVLCYRGELQIYLGSKGLTDACTVEHEKVHIEDYKQRYGPDVCRGVADYRQPHGGQGYSDFHRATECKAYKVGKKCREEKLKCETDEVKKILLKAKMAGDDEYLNKNCK